MQSARRAIDAVAANDLCAMQTCGVQQVRCPLIGVGPAPRMARGPKSAGIRHRGPFRALGNRHNLFESCQRDMPKSWFVAPALMPSAGQ